MLVLSRKKNEVIRIGDSISVIVVEIQRDKVRLGIQAPTNIPIHRREPSISPPAEPYPLCSEQPESELATKRGGFLSRTLHVCKHWLTRLYQRKRD